MKGDIITVMNDHWSRGEARSSFSLVSFNVLDVN